MPRETEPTINERQFFHKALAEGIRLDGRAFDQSRKIELDFGDEYGIADVRMGGTRVRTHVSTTISTPLPNHGFTGTLSLHVNLSPLATPLFAEASTRQALEAQLTHALDVIVRRSAALDMESLCLVAGRRCWAVRADMHVLAHDGGLLDAAAVSLLAALLHHRREDTEVVGQELRVFTRRERDGVPLALLHWPFAVTFSFYSSGDGPGGVEGKHAAAASSMDMDVDHDGKASEADDATTTLLDATLMEEHLRRGSLSIGLNQHGEVCHAGKLGGAPVDALTLLHCTRVASVRAQELSRLVKEALERDTKRRDQGGRMAAELSAENAR